MVWALLSAFALQLAVIYLPFLQKIFDTRPLSWLELLVTILASLSVLLVIEGWKFVARRR